MEDQIGVSEPWLPGEPLGELCKIHSAPSSHLYQQIPQDRGGTLVFILKKKHSGYNQRASKISGFSDLNREEARGSRSSRQLLEP